MRKPVLTIAAAAAFAGAVLASAQTSLTPYDCWSHLRFEEESTHIDSWSGNGTAITFVTDAAQAHGGTGALRIDGSAPASVWGPPVDGGALPEAGDLIGGYFWLKILAMPATGTGVDVRMTGYDHLNNETIYCQSTPIDLTKQPLNTWIKVNLASSSKSYAPSDKAGFNIVSSGGLDCLIDDITFGRLAGPVSPGGDTAAVGPGTVSASGGKISSARLKKIPPNNPNIKYVGRWTGDSKRSVSAYARPYLKMNFSGSLVAINLLRPVNLDVTIDGVSTRHHGVNGLVVLGSGLPRTSMHSVRIAGLSYDDVIEFDALHLDETGSPTMPIMASDHIEFVGDSITADGNGYAWRVPEAMKVEGSRIAWPGIALVNGFGYYTTTPPIVGMQDAYFDKGMPLQNSRSVPWNFSASPYTPNIVVINLGTNDGAAITGKKPLVNNFQAAYTTFIKRVKGKLPASEIFVLRAFSIHYADVNDAVEKAAKAAISSGDARVHYIDTSDWNVEIGPDGIHPTSAGQAAIADRLVSILRPYLKSSPKHPHSIP
ncbi:MAG: hypothetical protein K0R17_1488 [Rariglobus sp.]|jgi:lysophospholipase L1-like esterase|nr:hypothetical protein [Rariglobus sp.]